MQVIGAQCCANCKFGFRAPGMNGAVLCRRYPKQGGPLMVPVKAGMLQVQMHFGYPVQMDDETCGEWKPRLAVLANEMPQPAQDGPLDLTKYLADRKAEAA